ncbi:MAG TPA: ABC transporter permease [Gaiellaceae bacterium]|nr:ABC transporter permease [Gaiellaceae bacterium]
MTALPGTEPTTLMEARGAGALGLARRLVVHTAIVMAAIDALLILLFGLLSTDHLFLSLVSFQNLGFNAAQIVLLAVAATFELAAAQIDISLGSILVLSSIVGGEVIQHLGGTSTQIQAGSYPHLARALILGTAACVATGAAFGLANGLIVTRLRVNSFIATLGTTGIGLGIAFIITNGADLAYQPTWLQDNLGARNVLDVPMPALLVGVLVLALWGVLRFTRFGLHTLAVGSSLTSAERAGVRVDRHIIRVYVLAGALCGLASLLDLSRFATTNVAGHTNDALAAVAGAVIGGTSLFGGRASVIGSVFGALLAVILQSGLVAVGLTPFYQQVAVGVVLITAVYADRRRQSGV